MSRVNPLGGALARLAADLVVNRVGGRLATEHATRLFNRNTELDDIDPLHQRLDRIEGALQLTLAAVNGIGATAIRIAEVWLLFRSPRSHRLFVRIVEELESTDTSIDKPTKRDGSDA